MDIDRIDKAILMQLQRNNRLPNQDIAENVGLSPPACLKRVKRLRNMGAIIADTSILSAKILGDRIDIIFSVEMMNDTPEVFQQFSDSIINYPEVMQCYQVVGEYDFMLIASLVSIEALDNFSNTALRENPNVKRFKTFISKKRNKFTTVVEI